MAEWSADLHGLNLRPPIHTEDDLSFWDDEHISRSILDLHLDPDTDAASRRPQEVEREAEWIASQLPQGARVLDAGCGPGLYARQLASRGMSVVGVDINRAAIEHASISAEREGTHIEYRHGDVRDMDFKEEFDAALLIYGILGMMNDRDRSDVLHRLNRALRPGGILILDAMTGKNMRDRPFHKDWYFSPGGFWRPGPHFVLQRAFEYEGGGFLFRTIVLEEGKDVAVYDMWDHTFTADMMKELLSSHGFIDIEMFSGLSSGPFSDDASWIGVKCRKA